MPRLNYYNYKYNSLDGEGPRSQAQKSADKTRHSFPAFETQEDRVGMAGHHCQGRQAHPKHILPSQAPRDPNRSVALGNIQKQGHDAGRPACSAHYVGGANIAAARRAHIGAGFPSDQKVSERNRAEQVRDQQNRERNHDLVSGNSASLVYTEPEGRRVLWYR